MSSTPGRVPSARTQRRAAERLANREARQAGKAPNGTGPLAATEPPGDGPAPPAPEQLLGQVAHGAIPPTAMENLPPEVRGALEEQLRSAESAGKAEKLPAGAGAASTKRAKKYDQLEHELAGLLMTPGPMFLAAGDQFCAQHFMVRGPELAQQLVTYAVGHPATYDALLWMTQRGGILVVGMAIAGFVAPPLIHHGMLPAPEAVRNHYGLPPRDLSAAHGAPA